MFNTKTDVELSPGPTDTPSALAFSPVAQANYLAASSWDGQTRVWEVTAQGQCIAKTAIAHEGPSLCCAWSGDGGKLFSGGVDRGLRMLDWASGQSMQLPGAHDGPIRCMRWVNSSRIQALVTGSWDGTLRYWDLRQAQPLATVSLPERCYALDTSGDLLVVGTAERHVSVFNLGASPTQPHATMQSPLRWQTRSIACFPGGAGYAIGSIEGRVAFQYVDEKVGREQNFAYKCHREASDLVYPVNAIAFHPVHQRVLVTAGADGYMHTWDKDRRQRLESSVHLGASVTSVAFNNDGSLFAYGLGYDWLKGHEYYSATSRSAVLLHTVQDEFKPKAGLGNFVRR